MSTSPEAKQAAIHIVNGTSAETFQLGHIEGFVQQAIDAATAKLRDRQERMTDEMRHMNDLWARLHKLLDTGKDNNWDEEPFAKIAKLREELEEARADARRGWAGIGAAEERASIAEQKLAHQQPSAPTDWDDFPPGGLHASSGFRKTTPTPEPRQEGCTCGINWPCPLHGGPPEQPLWSELITKEGALAYFRQFLNGDKGVASAEVLADVMLLVQAQARAPLEWERDFYKCRCDALQREQSRMRDPERKAVCDILANGSTAALTGAGEKP